MNARQTRAIAVRRQVRIGKLTRTERLMAAAINEHRLLEPMQCDVEFMGSGFVSKLAAYRARHDRLLQAFAELTCERLAMQETKGNAE